MAEEKTAREKILALQADVLAEQSDAIKGFLSYLNSAEGQNFAAELTKVLDRAQPNGQPEIMIRNIIDAVNNASITLPNHIQQPPLDLVPAQNYQTE